MTSLALAAEPLAAPSLRPPPRNRVAVAVLSLLGLLVALYLLAYSVGVLPLLCGVASCATVQASEWAVQGGVPVPLIGVGGYLSLLAIALHGLRPRARGERRTGLLLFTLASIGLVYSAFLTYLEARVIHAWCTWCVVSAGLMTSIFLASLPELRRSGAA